jgi:RNA polymerase sigma-70 factor (ECF subfamily)
VGAPRHASDPREDDGAPTADPNHPDRVEQRRRAAFQWYVVPELDVLARVARSLTGSAHDAEDLVQDTLIRAYRAADRFDGESPRAWLLTIMRNTQKNRVRRRRPSLLRGGDDVRHRLAQEPGGEEPERLVTERLLDGRLDRAVRSLPARFRAVVELVDLAGLTYEEAATFLDIPAGTVMSRLHRARARLRGTLGDTVPLPRSAS